MKNLEKEYDISRYDIKTSEKLILKKYSETIKCHDHFDIRLENYQTNEILTLKRKSLEKIFSLAKEMAEEHILFLYMGENGNNKNNNFLPPIDTSLLINKITDSSTRLDIIQNNKNKGKLGENSSNSKISQLLCICSVLFFIIAGLLLIHFLQFIFSEKVRTFIIYYLSYLIFL